MSWRAAALVVALVAGCDYAAEDDLAMPAPDVATFTADLQPWMATRCSTLDCHGDAGRPMRLYAEDGLRAAAELRGQPITAAEVAFNARSVVGIDPFAPSAEQHTAVLKPLAVAAGGYDHVGGDVFLTTDDPDYLALRAWLAGWIGERAAAQPRP